MSSTQEKLDQVFFEQLRGKTTTEEQDHILEWAEKRLKPALAHLIDSAKREGKKKPLEKLVSLLHIYMDDKTPPGGEWPKQDMVVVVSFIESLVAQLEQSEESK